MSAGSGAPRVSVVIPAHNSAGVIELALASVAAQAYPALDVVLVDDASSDDTVVRARAALLRHALPHRILAQNRNLGPARARNLGVAAAQGEYVAFLDADDEWLPGKLAAQVAMMESDRTITLSGCQAVLVDETGRELEPLFRRLPSRLPDGWKRLLWDCYISTPCVIARRADLGDAPFDPALRVGEDRDLWIRLASRGTVGLVLETGVRIRISRGSFMPRNTEHIRTSTRPMIERHIARFGSRLSLRERLLARGSLNSQIGKSLCQSPRHFARGSLHLLASVAMGYRPLDGLREIAYRAPVLRDLKAFMKSVAARRQGRATP